MTITVVIALAAILLSTLTFIATQIGIRRTATLDYVGELERKLEKAQARIEHLEFTLEERRKEIVALYKELAKR